jgi:hypothetical protein
MPATVCADAEALLCCVVVWADAVELVEPAAVANVALVVITAALVAELVATEVVAALLVAAEVV